MRIIWPTGTRAGSEFAIKLTRSALGTATDAPYSAITPARIDSYAKEQGRLFEKGKCLKDWVSYFQCHHIEYCKIEHPGRDFLTVFLAGKYPECKFVTTVRDIESIIKSHSRIAWGHDPKQVIYNWMCDLPILEWLHIERKLFSINVDRPSSFDITRFCEFLGVEKSQQLVKFVESWPTVNSSGYQIEKHGARATQSRLVDLEIPKDFLENLGYRYEALVERLQYA